ncbi:MAG: OmpA family protein [Bacteroidota bacterium]
MILTRCTFILLLFLSMSSCISKKKFELAQAEQKQTYETELKALSEVRDTLQEALTFERGANHALFLTQERLQDRLDILQLEIDQLNQNASSTEQGLNANLRQKNVEIAQRQARIDGINNLLLQRSERLSSVEQEISVLFADAAMNSWSTRQRTGQLLVAINEDQLFSKGSTSRFTDDGETLLARIADVILRYPEMEVTVVGHTDNQPVNRQSLDNWQYSALRAVSVVKFLMDQNLGANRMLAASKSEFQPLESNETEEGRMRNRRVALIISPAAANFERDLNRFLKE